MIIIGGSIKGKCIKLLISFLLIKEVCVSIYVSIMFIGSNYKVVYLVIFKFSVSVVYL